MKEIKKTDKVVEFLKNNYLTMSNAELAKETGLSESYIGSILNKLNLKRNIPFTDTQIVEIETLSKKGFGLSKIARILGVTYNKLNYLACKFSFLRKKKQVSFYLDKDYKDMNIREKKAYEKWAKKNNVKI